MKNSEIRETALCSITSIYGNADSVNQISNIACSCKLIRSRINKIGEKLNDSELNVILKIIDRIEADINEIGKQRRISQNAVSMLVKLINIFSIEKGETD